MISDETSLYSRSCFAIYNFSKIINEISVLSNDSTGISLNKINLEKFRDAIINKNLIVCEYMNSEILKNVHLTLDSEGIEVFLNNIIEKVKVLSSFFISLNNGGKVLNRKRRTKRKHKNKRNKI